jgi:hypothetical protein
MAERAAARWHLADLVFAVLMCGLVAAQVFSINTPAGLAIVVFLGVIVCMSWIMVRQRRKAQACEECGGRFVQPKKAVMPAACPHCGREQVEVLRSLHRAKRLFWALLATTVLLVLMVFGLVVGFTQFQGGPLELVAAFGTVIAALGVLLAMLAAFSAAIYRAALMRPRERACNGCGGIIPAAPPAGPSICPQCRLRHLRPSEAKKARVKNLGAMLFVIGLLAFLGSFLIGSFIGPASDPSPWVGLLFFVLAPSAGTIIGLIGILAVIYLLRQRRLATEKGSIAMARKAARLEGEVVKDGPLAVWYSGPDNPVPMIREQLDAARRRFADLTGEAGILAPPFRILVFHDRGSFLRFHRQIFAAIDFAILDGVYLGHPHHISTLCTGDAVGRIVDPDRTLRSLAGYALLETIWGPRAVPWIQSGLSRATAAGDDPRALVRLNRRMVASIAAGTAMSTDIFAFSARDLGRVVLRSKDPIAWQKQQQFHNQAWSIVEFLAGKTASPDGPKSLGEFLRDPLSKTAHEESLRRHFGSGAGPLIAGWREWVLDRGIGKDDEPEPEIRSGLLRRVLPVIRDRQARRGDRLAAIREWANHGFILGSQSLIDLLCDPGDIPKEEVVHTLRMVSGMAWGDDPSRWQAWWDERRSEPADLPAGRVPEEAQASPSGD